jgi:hypothetical protein
VRKKLCLIHCAICSIVPSVYTPFCAFFSALILFFNHVSAFLSFLPSFFLSSFLPILLFICLFQPLFLRSIANAPLTEALCYQAGSSRVRFPMASLEFFINIILPAAQWPWGWLCLKQKWVPGIFPGGKGGWCVGLTTLPPRRADCHETREPVHSGTLRVCPGLYRNFFLLPSIIPNVLLVFSSPCASGEFRIFWYQIYWHVQLAKVTL